MTVPRSTLAAIVDNNISAKPIFLTRNEAEQRLNLSRYDRILLKPGRTDEAYQIVKKTHINFVR